MRVKFGLSMIMPVLLLGVSGSAFAHVRWFVRDVHQYSDARFVLDGMSVLLIMGAIAYGAFCFFLNAQTDRRRRSDANHWLYRLFGKRYSLKGVEWGLIKASVVLMFVGNLFEAVFVAPNLDSALVSKDLFFILQGMILVALAFHELVLGVALLVLTSFILVFHGFGLAVDYLFEFVALAAFFCFMGIRRLPMVTRHLGWSEADCVHAATTTLRVGVGLQLAVLAIHNKFMNPGIGLAFLDSYPYFNFMPLLGVSQFDDIHFVLSAGLAELTFGLLLVLNIAPRFVALSVGFFFTATSIVLGFHEIMGHVVIVAALLVIALYPSERGVRVSLSSAFGGLPRFRRVEKV